MISKFDDVFVLDVPEGLGHTIHYSVNGEVRYFVCQHIRDVFHTPYTKRAIQIPKLTKVTTDLSKAYVGPSGWKLSISGTLVRVSRLATKGHYVTDKGFFAECVYL